MCRRKRTLADEIAEGIEERNEDLDRCENADYYEYLAEQDEACIYYLDVDEFYAELEAQQMFDDWLEFEHGE